MAALNLDHLEPLRAQLEAHAIYGAIQSVEDLRTFMQHHVFSVWDFMSLIKYLQRAIAPVQVPWTPTSDPSLRYFINQLTLEEESDAIPLDSGETLYASHFELYRRAMSEIGANADMPLRFLELVAEQGIDKALYSDIVPLPARYFTETTFCFIREDKPHLVAAALALGRENLIPAMFRQLLDRMGIDAEQAPTFHAYLSRHIHLDEDFHGPLSLKLLETLCGDDPKRIEEAETAAEEALCARIRFWDGVLEAIQAARG
ncbi:DUF3050 domain-containing protein [Thiorhodococcus minor]|uniref:DUF3050 domain-containing protein n=1 Tax=Thiorhodococcus minor TaxID=57489 RepID=A0A6M0K6F7_9GAMM|nr:DUF3050 domain-containing protein [Thiorhodococcus minor]NEV64804.1 DUF3050 domain-containing protein [Thiorhodococcus minor]